MTLALAPRAAAPPHPVDDLARVVADRLEHAGRTVLAMPRTGYSTAMRVGGLDVVRVVAESYGWSSESIRAPAPSAAEITRMDEAYGWLALIPDSQIVIRRIVGARSLVHPVSYRHLYTWRAIGSALNMHHNTVQKCHAEGIRIIVAALLRGAA